jgi:hypothetical protein
MVTIPGRTVAEVTIPGRTVAKVNIFKKKVSYS